MATILNTDTTEVSVFVREETCLKYESKSQALATQRAENTLIFADPYEQDINGDAVVDFFKACRNALKNGGSIAVPCDLRTLTKISKALEAAGFKQLRFVQAVSETPEKDFYPKDSRTMMLLAVKGGASTFNSIYNNGHYPRPEESNKGTPILPTSTCPKSHLISEIVSVHSIPGDETRTGDAIATTSRDIQSKLETLLSIGSIEFRIKPDKPPKKPKVEIEQVA